MGKVIIALGGAGGIDPDECTAGRPQVLSGYTAGVHGEDDPAPGSMPERGAWSSSVGMNGSVTIPEGHHNGSGKITGPTVTQRGAWNSRIGINGRATIPEGYHNGKGYVDQAIATQGGQTINPSASQQTVSTSGKYMTGNIIVNAISLPNASDLREGVNWYGRVGTMKDYSYLAVNQVPFDGASFSGVMAGGAQEMFTSPGNPDYVNKKTLAITSNGVELTASRNSYTENKFCPNYAIDLSPFKTIRVSGKMLTPNPRARGNLFIQVWSKNTHRTFFFRKYPGVVNLKESKTELPYITDNPNYVQCYLDVGTINEAVFITIFFQVLNSEPYAEGYRYCFNKIEFLT